MKREAVVDEFVWPIVAREMQYVETDTLRSFEFNPESRTVDKNIEDLKTTINGLEGIIVPLIVTPSGVVIEGNRRLKCAIDLKIPWVPVIVYEGDPVKAFLNLNAGVRKLTGKEETELYARFGFSPANKTNKYSEIDFLTSDDWELIVALKKSVDSNYQLAKTFMKYAGIDNTNENKRKVLMWVIEKNATMPVRHAMSIGIDPKRILECIDSNKPFFIRK